MCVRVCGRVRVNEMCIRPSALLFLLVARKMFVEVFRPGPSTTERTIDIHRIIFYSDSTLSLCDSDDSP